MMVTMETVTSEPSFSPWLAAMSTIYNDYYTANLPEMWQPEESQFISVKNCWLSCLNLTPAPAAGSSMQFIIPNMGAVKLPNIFLSNVSSIWTKPVPIYLMPPTSSTSSTSFYQWPTLTLPLGETLSPHRRAASDCCHWLLNLWGSYQIIDPGCWAQSDIWRSNKKSWFKQCIFAPSFPAVASHPLLPLRDCDGFLITNIFFIVK